MSSVSFASLIAIGDFSAAVKVLDSAIDETKQDYASALHRLAQLHVNRGICNQKLHLNRKALKDYDAALALMPSNVNALLRKGQVLQLLGKHAEAHVVWEAASSLADPASDLEVLLEIQLALQQTGSFSSVSQSSSAATPTANGAALHNAATASQAMPQVNGATPAPTGLKSFTSSCAAATADGAAEAAAVGNGPAAANTSTTAAAAQPKSQMSKGFLRPAPSKPAPAAARAAGDAAGPKMQLTPPNGVTSSGKSSSKDTSPSSRRSTPDGIVEIDCAAEQQQSRIQQPTASTFGAQVQQMAQNSVALQIAISQINAGQVEQAEALLDGIIASNPKEMSALVARGTARALRRKLNEAIEDFTAAIQIEPRYPDCYKRRGQARSALGDHQGALDDLEKAAQLSDGMPGAAEGMGGKADCYAERGMLYQKLRDYRRAVKELQKATELDSSNPQAWNYLGMCRVSMGDIREGCRAYEKALELVPNMKEAWLNLGQALKEAGRVKEAERALTQAMTNPDGSPCLAAYRLLATMRQGQGKQTDAIKVLDKALSYKREEQKIELLYLRAICYHALGYARKAQADYDACMNCQPRMDEGPVAEESRMFQFLSFYQREIALFVAHNLDKRAVDFCLDTELSPAFKECWCKKGPPTQELFATYRVQPALANEGRGSSSGGSSSPTGSLSDGSNPQHVSQLTTAADTVGNLLQNHHQGFLPNVRQQRAAGYAAIELAQAVRALTAERRAGREGLWVNSEGSSGERGCSGRHLFGWRDAMDIVVKWRQLSEPADQVVWVDLLTQREFEQGFGSHTPMYSGQTKCVRYYMNFNRAMSLAKECLLEKGHAYDAQNCEVGLGSDDKQEAVRRAKTALELYTIIGQDSWVVVPLHSLLKEQKQEQQHDNATPTSNGNIQSSSSSSSSFKRVSDVTVAPGCIEGTRLTLVKVPNQPDAVEFSIRTPVTPPRWKEFDAELEYGWERLINAMISGNKAATAAAILCYGYYWYNFMPLARGTAAVGYTTMLGLFWAAEMPITQPIPKDYQVDWEAILARHPQQFIERLAQWFIPEQACPPAPAAPAAASISPSSSNSPMASPRSSDAGSSSGKGQHAALIAAAKQLPDVESLPAVNQALGTIKQRFNALNGPDAKPV